MLRRARLKVLRLRLLRMEILLLIVMMLLLARIIWLRLARCERLTADARLLVVAVLVALVSAAHLARLLLLIVRLTLPELLLRGRDQTEIVLGVLEIIFRRNRITGALRIASKLQIFFSDVGSCSSNFYVRPVGLVHSGQWILVMMATLAVTTAHTFVLTVSHGLLFRQPLDYLCNGRFCRRFLSSFTALSHCR